MVSVTGRASSSARKATASLFPAVASLALVAIPVNEAKVAFDRMFEIIGAGEDTDESREALVLHDVGKLSIENLSFRFTGRKLLLEDMDRNGVDIRMVSALYGYSIPEQNAAVAKFAQDNPGKILACAVINPKERNW